MPEPVVFGAPVEPVGVEQLAAVVVFALWGAAERLFAAGCACGHRKANARAAAGVAERVAVAAWEIRWNQVGAAAAEAVSFSFWKTNR